MAKKSNTLNSTEVEVKKVVKKTNPTERKTSGSQIDTAKRSNTKNSSKTTSRSSKGQERYKRCTSCKEKSYN